MRIGPAGSERPIVRIDETHYLDVSDVVGDFDEAFRIPRGSTKLDREVELGVVISKRTSYLDSVDDAHGAIAGYVVVNDVSSASKDSAPNARPLSPPIDQRSDMSTPVVVTAYFYPAPGQHDQVVEALRPAIAAVHEESGCELYAIHDAPNGSIVMIEKWTSVGELDDHGVGKLFGR